MILSSILFHCSANHNKHYTAQDYMNDYTRCERRLQVTHSVDPSCTVVPSQIRNHKGAKAIDIDERRSNWVVDRRSDEIHDFHFGSGLDIAELPIHQMVLQESHSMVPTTAISNMNGQLNRMTSWIPPQPIVEKMQGRATGMIPPKQPMSFHMLVVNSAMMLKNMMNCSPTIKTPRPR